MRAGQLNRTIAILARGPDELDAARAPTPTWRFLAEVRAELVEADTAEFLRGYGEEGETAIVFRIRYLSGVTTACRVVYEYRNFDVKAVKEVGRRRGLELRLTAAEE